MDLQLTNKTALVTAGTGGIGLAIAKELDAEGAHVLITGRSQEKLNAVRNFRGHGILADVSTRSGVQTVIEQLPHVDILVNNLGIYEPKAFSDITDEDWFRIFETNVMSGVRLARYYLPQMLQRDWGRIIFVSSESAVMTPQEMIHYGVTKSAQLAIARGLAETTIGSRVTVNSVLPGPTRSEGVEVFLQQLASSPNATPEEAEREFFEKHRPSSLLQRLIEPSEVASLVAYLASPCASATNGAAVRVEGGLVRSIV